jgi:hypothetical protein
MNMLRTRWLLPLLAALPVLACSGDDYLPSPVGSDAGPIGRPISDADFRDQAPDAATGGDADTDAPGADATPATKITITVLTPAAAAVVPAAQKFTPSVEVRVEAPANTAGETLQDLTVDVLELPSRKKVATGKLNQVGLEALPESDVVVYRFADTPIDVAAVPSGNYELLVTATTSAGTEAHTTVAFQIDGGPLIRVDTPVADRSYRGSAPIDVTISDALFGPVSDVQMKVGQHTVAFAGPGGASGNQYTATLDFASYMPALEGEQILTVRARNRNGTEAVVTRKFVSDSKGPAITEARPKDGELVGNVVTIQAEVRDPAGVLASSVVAVFANGPGTEYTIALNAPAPGTTPPVYSAIFDTRLLPFGENALYPTLSFRASDNLGNESLLSNVVWLDNRPPLAELDPPEMRMLAKNEANVLACSWPFDPVGPDAADDLDIVPQIVDVRARVEDQGNQPLSGSPNYIPIAGVDVTQLLILDDTTQPLVVNTNPVAKGNKKADTLCDAINPLLVPTTRPMTSKDALLITLFPVAPVGAPDLTNWGGLLIGDDGSCYGGGNTKMPEPACEVTYNSAKAKWRIMSSNGATFIDLHSEIVRLFPGYAGTGAGLLPSVWTIPKQESGSANLLCGGTQLDTLANFVNDGWACMAIFASDKLGNKQVSKPFRLCVDKDVDGKECPHKEIAAVRDGTPLTVETVTDHGYTTGDQVKVSGIAGLATIINQTWTVTVTGPRSFTLNGSLAQPVITGYVWHDWLRPARPVGAPMTFIPGHVVRVTDVPNCTGTQTAEPPMTAVDATACSPWRTYAPGEIRRF